MGIDVHSDRYAGVPGAFAGDFRMNAFSEEVRDMGMPQAMKTDACDARILRDTAKFLREVARVDRLAIESGENQPGIVSTKAHLHSFLHLANSMLAKGLNRDRGQRHIPGAVVLGGTETPGFRYRQWLVRKSYLFRIAPQTLIPRARNSA